MELRPALAQGVTGFQVAQGNFVSLFFPLGREAVKEEIICVGLRRLGLPWDSAGFYACKELPLCCLQIPGPWG